MVAALIASIYGSAGAAVADQTCHTETQTIEVNGVIQTVVKKVCTDTGTSTGGGHSGSSSGCSSSPGHQISCTTPEGYHWFDSQFCYAMNVTGVYPPTDAAWLGHADGSLWACVGVGPTMTP